MSIVEICHGKKVLVSVGFDDPPFEDLDEAKFQLGIMGHSKKFGPGSYPCLGCHGGGRVVADGEQADPVEGYKMARRVDCPTCKGTGYGTRKAFMAYYGERAREWEKERKDKLRGVELAAKALSRLSAEEAGKVVWVLRNDGADYSDKPKVTRVDVSRKGGEKWR